MKFAEKYQLVKKAESMYNESLERELADYTYSGHVDFVDCPTCAYDLDNNMVVPFGLDNPTAPEQKYYVLKNGQATQMGRRVKFIQMATVKFSKSFGLQDFFDKNKGSIGMVFYVPQEHPGTIFHAGNHIRVAIITSKMYEKEVTYSEAIEGA